MAQNEKSTESNEEKTIEINSSLMKSSFMFTIENFNDMNETKMTSSLFTIEDNTKWFIYVKTNFTKDNMEYVSVYLCLKESDKPIIKVKYCVSIIDANNKIFKKLATEIIDYENGSSWGFDSFIRRDQLTESSNNLLTDNNLKLHFIIDLIDIKQFNDFKLLNGYKRLINNKELSDFKFIVEDKELYAHKVILSARSEVFRAMFSNDMIENRVNICEIPDFQYDVFELLITYIYTGITPKVESMTSELLAAAEKYQILQLKDICEDIIYYDLTIKNAIQTLMIADKYNATKILDKVMDFIIINRALICSNSETDLKKLIVENPGLFLKLFKVNDRKTLSIKCENGCNYRNWIQ